MRVKYEREERVKIVADGRRTQSKAQPKKPETLDGGHYVITLGYQSVTLHGHTALY